MLQLKYCLIVRIGILSHKIFLFQRFLPVLRSLGWWSFLLTQTVTLALRAHKAVTSFQPPRRRSGCHRPLPLTAPGGRGHSHTQELQSSRGRAQGWATTEQVGFLSLKCYHFSPALPLLSVRLDIGHYWVLKTCLLNNKYEALSIKEIRPVMSKTRLNKRK